MRKISLTQGKFALVSDGDFEWLNQWKWNAYKHRDTFYARRTAKRSEYSSGTRPNVPMHRAILNAPKGMQVDHVNGNGLDNRRENLRLCTNSQNQMNRGLSASNTSGYKGVSWDKGKNKWGVELLKDGVRKSLGHFQTKEDAARAYNEAAKKYFGEFARLNDVL